MSKKGRKQRNMNKTSEALKASEVFVVHAAGVTRRGGRVVRSEQTAEYRKEVRRMAERDSKGRFVKGNKASPGRPKLPEDFKTRAKTYADEALERLAEVMRDRNAKHSDVIRACELLLDRGYGRVTMSADVRIDADENTVTGVILIPTVRERTEADGA